MNAATLAHAFVSPGDIAAAVPPALAQMGRHGVLAYPTETVYGFGGGLDPDSVAAVLHVKGRDAHKPILILVSGVDMLATLRLRVPAYAERFMARHWPGPLTLVLAGGVPSMPSPLRGPEGGVAVRSTSHR